MKHIYIYMHIHIHLYIYKYEHKPVHILSKVSSLLKSSCIINIELTYENICAPDHTLIMVLRHNVQKSQLAPKFTMENDYRVD